MKKNISLLILFLSCSFLQAQTICLNMIVKDEVDVIARCLNSVKPYIDYWVIVDTGSNDGTQDAILECMKGIPGKLYQSTWTDFGTNRNEALDYARNLCDYTMFIDADEVLKIDSLKPFENLDKDYYYAHVLQRQTASRRILLVSSKRDWNWKGVIHESLDSKTANTRDILAHAKISAETRDGCRSKDPNKALKDAAVLEKAIIDEPNNARYRFFLAQCYHNAKEYEKALKHYAHRSTMGGWDQEEFYALFQVARMQQQLKYDPQIYIKTYNLAAAKRPSRPEPLFELAKYYLLENHIPTSYFLAKQAISLPFSDDVVHVDAAISKWGAKVILAEAAFKMGFAQEALNLTNEVLAITDLPKDLCDVMPKFKLRCEEGVAQAIFSQLIQSKNQSVR